jgi:hypothetical protein
MNNPGHISSPIHTYVHPERHSRIDLIGMIHIGEASYYQRVQNIVDARNADGALTHYEMVKRAGTAELTTAPRRVQANVQRVRAIMRNVDSLFEGLDLTHQKKGLMYRQSWENHDTTEIDEAARMSTIPLSGLLMATRAMRAFAQTLPPNERRDLLVQNLQQTTNNLHSRQSPLKRLLYGNNERVIIDYRNDIALEAIDNQLQEEPESDLVLLWGMGHLAGLGAGLKNRGFSKVDEQRLVAIHLTAA